jgi:NAD-dependent deacetylase
VEFQQDLIEMVREAGRILFFTGAGVSAESGVPTFRDPQQGLWAKFRPEELAKPQAFARDPETVWRWYQWRRRVHSGVKPNPAHAAIAVLQRRFPASLLVTQNVDRLHELAGSLSPVHLHGHLFTNKCAGCGAAMPEVPLDLEAPPSCADCGGLCRPDIVWFGEGLPIEPWDAALKAAQEADLVFSIGTSATVVPAAELPRIAHRNGAAIIQVNPAPTPLDPIAHNLRGPAATILPALLAALGPA